MDGSIAPSLSAVVLFRKFGMEAVAQGYYAVGVGLVDLVVCMEEEVAERTPETEKTASFTRRATGYL